MKLAVIAAAAAMSLLASCKDKPRELAPAPSPGSGSAPAAPSSPDGGAAPAATIPEVCRIGVAALEQATCPTPEVRQSLLVAKRSLDSVIEMVGKTGGAEPRQLEVMCAQILLAIEQDAAKLSCTVALDAGQRAKVAALLDAWSAQRTPVTPTGDAAADAVIARIAAVRDAACACQDGACLDGLNQQLAAVGAMPEAAPEAARALGKKLLEDAARCASRARTQAPPPR